MYQQTASSRVNAPRTHLRLIDENLSVGPIPLIPIEAQWSSVQWQNDMVCDQVGSGHANTEPTQPIYTKYTPIQSEDGEFDNTDTPGVDENVCEGDLSNVSPARVCPSM